MAESDSNRSTGQPVPANAPDRSASADRADTPSDRTDEPSASPAEGISANRRVFFGQILRLGIEQAEKATDRFDRALEQLAGSPADPAATPPRADESAPGAGESKHQPPDAPLTPPENTQPRS